MGSSVKRPSDLSIENLARLDLARLNLRSAEDLLRRAKAKGAASLAASALRNTERLRRRAWRAFRIASQAVSVRHDLAGVQQPLFPEASWRVWVSVASRPEVTAVAHIDGVSTAREAEAIVNECWSVGDWDSEAFGYEDQAGRWRYYQLRLRDRVVVDRVEKVERNPPRLWRDLAGQTSEPPAVVSRRRRARTKPR